MTTARLAARSRFTYQVCATGVRICLDEQPLGPVLSKRSARTVIRWLEGGALAELLGEGVPKIQRVLGDVDRAIDSVADLMRNGLR